MSADLHVHLRRLSEAEKAELETFLLAFDAPGVAIDFAAAVALLATRSDAFRHAALLELALIDLERRWVAGETAAAGFYFVRAPELEQNPTSAVTLLLAHCRHAREHGKPLDLARLRKLHPNHADLVWPLLEPPTEPITSSDRSRSSESTIAPVKGTTTTPPLPPHVQLPTEFGRYRIVRHLGGGGMADVFLAFDTHLKRQVALKVPKAYHVTEVRERFLREAHAAAVLSHPNLCRIYDGK